MWSLIRPKSKRFCILLVGLFFILGGLRIFLDYIYLARPAMLNLADRSVSLRGRVVSLPSSRGERAEYRLAITEQFTEGSWQGARGALILQTRVYPKFEYGDVLSFTCETEMPRGFSFGRLAVRRASLSCRVMGGIERLEIKKGDPLLAALFVLRARALDRLGQFLPEPQAGLAGGLIVGERAHLPSDLVAALRRTGTLHIIAISGFNVAMITRTLLALLSAVLGRRRAFWATIAFLFGFVFLVGASSSVVRAAVMGGTVLLAEYIGRRGAGFRLLLLAAALMLLVNPWLLIYDVGFILSFAATAGLLIFGKPLAKRLWFLPEASRIRETIAETLAATMTTLPITMFAFGQISFISPLANLAVLLIVPAATWFILAAVIFGTIPLIGAFFVWLTSLLLTAILGFIEFLGPLPFAAVNLGVFSYLGAVLALVAVVLLYFYFKKRHLQDYINKI